MINLLYISKQLNWLLDLKLSSKWSLPLLGHFYLKYLLYWLNYETKIEEHSQSQIQDPRNIEHFSRSDYMICQFLSAKYRWRYHVRILSWKISSAIWYDNFELWPLTFLLLSRILYENLLVEKYHQWYNMIFLSKYLLSKILYDMFEQIVIIKIRYNILSKYLSSKTLPLNTCISKNF